MEYTDKIAAEAWNKCCDAFAEQDREKGVSIIKSAIEKAIEQDREENLSFLELDYINKLRAAHASETCVLEVDSPVHPAGWDEYLQCGCHRCLDYIRRYILSLEKQPAHASEPTSVEQVRAIRDEWEKREPAHASEQVRPDGWYRVPNAGRDVWHKKGVGFCLTKDLPAYASDGGVCPECGTAWPRHRGLCGGAHASEYPLPDGRTK